MSERKKTYFCPVNLKAIAPEDWRDLLDILSLMLLFSYRKVWKTLHMCENKMAESSRLGVNLIRPLFAHWFFQTPAVETSGKTKGFMPFFMRLVEHQLPARMAGVPKTVSQSRR